MPITENLDIFFDPDGCIDLTTATIESNTGEKFEVQGYYDESMLDDDGVLRMIKQLTIKQDSRVSDYCYVYIDGEQYRCRKPHIDNKMMVLSLEYIRA